MLTVIGFSVQDKIVVFDRSGNSGVLRRLPFEKLVNHSIIQNTPTLDYTQLMTVEFTLLALALFRRRDLREFASSCWLVFERHLLFHLYCSSVPGGLGD